MNLVLRQVVSAHPSNHDRQYVVSDEPDSHDTHYTSGVRHGVRVSSQSEDMMGNEEHMEGALFGHYESNEGKNACMIGATSHS